jgi:hypothetical protein
VRSDEFVVPAPEFSSRKFRGDALPQALGLAAGRRRVVVDVGVIYSAIDR